MWSWRNRNVDSGPRMAWRLYTTGLLQHVSRISCQMLSWWRKWTDQDISPRRTKCRTTPADVNNYNSEWWRLEMWEGEMNTDWRGVGNDWKRVRESWRNLVRVEEDLWNSFFRVREYFEAEWGGTEKNYGRADERSDQRYGIARGK